MTISRKKEREILREKYVESIISYFSVDENVLKVKSNEIIFPVIGDEGNEAFIVITVNVTTESYNGYALAEEYELEMKEKEAKTKEREEKKKKKNRT